MIYDAFSVDIVVIGAGHAGIEAALAASKLGCTVALFTISLDAVGNMPCNPSVGGTGKGQLVFEADALGGEIGRAADAATLQQRMLCESKGAAVRSKRVQADRRMYSRYMKRILGEAENLRLIQGEITELLTENGAVTGVITRLGAKIACRAVVVCSGTYLSSRVITGDVSYPSGPDGMHAASSLSASLEKAGVTLRRFKTGTPPRVDAKTIDFSKMTEQKPAEESVRYSSRTDPKALAARPTLSCYITYTNEETHRIIRENIGRSPLYSGDIKGVGPRYCPSIEDKVMRFPDKTRHQVFVEPTGLDNEMYLQGLSSSLPEDVQLRVVHSCAGLENAAFMRTAYAIEYDCADATEMLHTLEYKKIKGLYGAGQFNGTSGYEEAAAQGLIAGINAALKIKGREPLILPRESSYIGTLIDDVVTKPTAEPYRMMTSRTEYRLTLRQDNADERLCEIGHSVGLVTDGVYEAFKAKRERIEKEEERCRSTVLPPSEKLNSMLEAAGEPPVGTGVRLSDLLKRPAIDYKTLAENFDMALDPKDPADAEAILTVETDIKYEGYVKKQKAEIARARKFAERKLPEDISWLEFRGITREAAQKLDKLRPGTVGEASRISGVSPADITAIMIYLDMR